MTPEQLAVLEKARLRKEAKENARARLLKKSEAGILGPVARGKQIEAETMSDQQSGTRAVQELPEIGFSGLLQGEDPVKVAQAATALLVTPNPREAGNILTSIFPHIGITQDEQGNLIAGNNKNQVQAMINKPDASPMDLLQALGIGAAFTPGASVAGGALSIPGKLLAGGSTAGLTQAGIETLQQQLGGELDQSEIAIAASLGGVAELAMPVINAYRNAKQLKKADVTTNVSGSQLEEATPAMNQASEAQGKIKSITGEDFELFPAQQTLIPVELLKQRILPQLEPGARVAMNNLNRQNDQAFNATLKLIDRITPEANSGAPQALKTAAQRAIEAQKLVRKEAANFGQAIKASDDLNLGKDVNVGNVKSLLDDLFEKSPQDGPLEKFVVTMRRRLTPREGREFLTYEQLQRAKKELDSMINKSPVSPDAPDPSIKGKIIGIKKALVDEMENASPAYKKAREVFEAESPAVEALQNSMIGRLADVSDKQLKNIASEIFNPRTTVKDITRTRQIIESVDPVAWRDIVRNELDFRVGSLGAQIKEQGADAVANLPGLLKRSLFGNPRQREVLLRSMTKQQRENFKYLETMLSRAAAGRSAGSPTASFSEIMNRWRGRMGELKDVFFLPLKTIQETGDEVLFNRTVKAMTEVMFNPKWQPRLTEIRKLGSKSPAAARAMVQLVDDAMPTIAENVEETAESQKQIIDQSISDVREQANR